MTDRPNVTVNVFPGGFNWALYVGIDRGLFARQGIDVTILATPNSVAQMTGLSQGRFEIAMTAVDNIVAYVEGQGEAPIGAQPDFFAFMGSDSGFLSLVVRPNIERVSDLAGRTLSVDAMTTGYAFVLFEILRRHGLQRGEFQIRKVGGMIQRYDSLIEGREDGTLLSAPYSILAKHHGLTEMVKAASLLGSYQGNVAAARRSWARKNETQVIAFIRGYREAITWLYEPSHREAAIGILMRNVPKMSHGLAEATYTELLDSNWGFFRDCAISLPGMECVLDLRGRYSGLSEALLDPMKYCDLSYYRSAIG